ncbi:hypothetical protein NDU88_001656 [Pleurodeles waltl]|uniref:Uncharacterized protein n=1 Tax=Pleurodeles waltl TaxID=8319 RepID=A0AAV7UVY9_PLEWA|nr:hypothetical protein NDU88_001656 [Pleurodeles waltl]
MGTGRQTGQPVTNRTLLHCTLESPAELAQTVAGQHLVGPLRGDGGGTPWGTEGLDAVTVPLLAEGADLRAECCWGWFPRSPKKEGSRLSAMPH